MFAMPPWSRCLISTKAPPPALRRHLQRCQLHGKLRAEIQQHPQVPILMVFPARPFPSSTVLYFALLQHHFYSGWSTGNFSARIVRRLSNAKRPRTATATILSGLQHHHITSMNLHREPSFQVRQIDETLQVPIEIVSWGGGQNDSFRCEQCAFGFN